MARRTIQGVNGIYDWEQVVSTASDSSNILQFADYYNMSTESQLKMLSALQDILQINSEPDKYSLSRGIGVTNVPSTFQMRDGLKQEDYEHASFYLGKVMEAVKPIVKKDTSKISFSDVFYNDFYGGTNPGNLDAFYSLDPDITSTVGRLKKLQEILQRYKAKIEENGPDYYEGYEDLMRRINSAIEVLKDPSTEGDIQALSALGFGKLAQLLLATQDSLKPGYVANNSSKEDNNNSSVMTDEQKEAAILAWISRGKTREEAELFIDAMLSKQRAIDLGVDPDLLPKEDSQIVTTKSEEQKVDDNINLTYTRSDDDNLSDFELFKDKISGLIKKSPLGSSILDNKELLQYITSMKNSIIAIFKANGTWLEYINNKSSDKRILTELLNIQAKNPNIRIFKVSEVNLGISGKPIWKLDEFSNSLGSMFYDTATDTLFFLGKKTWEKLYKLGGVLKAQNGTEIPQDGSKKIRPDSSFTLNVSSGTSYITKTNPNNGETQSLQLNNPHTGIQIVDELKPDNLSVPKQNPELPEGSTNAFTFSLKSVGRGGSAFSVTNGLRTIGDAVALGRMARLAKTAGRTPNPVGKALSTVALVPGIFRGAADVIDYWDEPDIPVWKLLLSNVGYTLMDGLGFTLANSNPHAATMKVIGDNLSKATSSIKNILNNLGNKVQTTKLGKALQWLHDGLTQPQVGEVFPGVKDVTIKTTKKGATTGGDFYEVILTKTDGTTQSLQDYYKSQLLKNITSEEALKAITNESDKVAAKELSDRMTKALSEFEKLGDLERSSSWYLKGKGFSSNFANLAAKFNNIIRPTAKRLETAGKYANHPITYQSLINYGLGTTGGVIDRMNDGESFGSALGNSFKDLWTLNNIVHNSIYPMVLNRTSKFLGAEPRTVTQQTTVVGPKPKTIKKTNGEVPILPKKPATPKKQKVAKVSEGVDGNGKKVLFYELAGRDGKSNGKTFIITVSEDGKSAVVLNPQGLQKKVPMSDILSRFILPK